VRFSYEWHDDSGSWFRSYGNEKGVREQWSHAAAARLDK
jgi:nuclear transport factor 2 (NTF2) superfamily protein